MEVSALRPITTPASEVHSPEAGVVVGGSCMSRDRFIEPGLARTELPLSALSTSVITCTVGPVQARPGVHRKNSYVSLYIHMHMNSSA